MPEWSSTLSILLIAGCSDVNKYKVDVQNAKVVLVGDNPMLYVSGGINNGEKGTSEVWCDIPR